MRFFFFFSSRRRHTRFDCDWSSDVCSSDLVAGMAEAFNLPVVSHLVPELHVHLIAAIPHGLTVEYMPWTLRLYEETPRLENGHLIVPATPGFGLAFDQTAL